MDDDHRVAHGALAAARVRGDDGGARRTRAGVAMTMADLAANAGAALLFVLVACALGGLLYAATVDLLFDGSNPLTRIGRAKMARRRAVHARAAELIARGYSEYSALSAAEAEMEQEARETTRALRSAGVEP